jgi:uncharacterized protein
MPKKMIKKFLPHPDVIKNSKALAMFGHVLHDHNLWHLHRRTARGAFAIGAFVALIPMPFQTVLAIALAIFFRVNVPIAFALCWVTNPFTMGPVFYFCYSIGAIILGQPVQDVEFHASFEWLLASIETYGGALLVGSFAVAIACSAFLFFAVDWFWRLSVLHAWRKRQKKYAEKKRQLMNQEKP